ncbi:cytochrome P450 26C1, partial [Gadus morhua]|uniref:cytochrome P450 26C1 n=1 Tax=Gadus morhua TaxID=8049 RepID=UPI0011B6B90F
MLFSVSLCSWPSLSSSAVLLLLPLLLLAASRQLWSLRWSLTRDRASSLPLPQGSMGWPLVGETFSWLLQGPDFHVSRRRLHGNVFKTHLLGRPLVRVTGAHNLRKILLGEHSLVCTQWPQSTRILLGPGTLVNASGGGHRGKRKLLAKAFSRGALDSYLPRLQEEVRAEVSRWCLHPGPVEVYAAAKTLTFRIAAGVLLGLRLDEERTAHLARTFETLMDNLFSLPLDTPLSGLRKGIRAREVLHLHMEQIIQEKLAGRRSEEVLDAFDYMLSSAQDQGQSLSPQELKEMAVELIFAAHSTTASASTSLILQLLRHPAVVEQARAELQAHGLGSRCPAAAQKPGTQDRLDLDRTLDQTPDLERTLDQTPDLERTPDQTPDRDQTQDKDQTLERTPDQTPDRDQAQDKDQTLERTPDQTPDRDQAQDKDQTLERTPDQTPDRDQTQEKDQTLERTPNQTPDRDQAWGAVPYLTMERLGRLQYLDCVVKEVLRILPPVSGGYRTALQTFELDGYQIP